jgi:hypothetical protein
MIPMAAASVALELGLEAGLRLTGKQGNTFHVWQLVVDGR